MTQEERIYIIRHVSECLTKLELIKLAYGKIDGIDTAIPRGYVEARGLRHGGNDPIKNLFFYVTDCRNGKNSVVFLPNEIPEPTMIRLHEIYEYSQAIIHRDIRRLTGDR